MRSLSGFTAVNGVLSGGDGAGRGREEVGTGDPGRAAAKHGSGGGAPRRGEKGDG
ncbi:hypothetical protein HMPREF9056_00973 [Actinomyces sp. oral taxon 170 str. F0386]|nr:hypothetical protein HMPREF9056_00973 [Actinomyces sp. oral taxon 170 str. F0386]